MTVGFIMGLPCAAAGTPGAKQFCYSVRGERRLSVVAILSLAAEYCHDPGIAARYSSPANRNRHKSNAA
jgi:hypothetical protein